MPLTIQNRELSSGKFRSSFRFARVWEIERTDGVSLYFTDHSEQIEYLGNTYEPAVFDSTAATQSVGFEENNIELRGFLASSHITKEELRARLYSNAKITVRVIDWRYPYAGEFRTDIYNVESVKYTGEVWEASVLGLSGILRRKVGKVLNRDCNVERIGDARCGVDIESHRVSGEITAIDESDRVFQTDLTGADGLYEPGEITWTSGDNAGLISETKTNQSTNGVVELQVRTPFPASVGDGFTIIPDCRRVSEDCKGADGTGGKPWPDNSENFRGFPDMPGARVVMKTPNAK